MYVCLDVLVRYDARNLSRKQFIRCGRINQLNIASCWLPNQLAFDISKEKKGEFDTATYLVVANCLPIILI